MALRKEKARLESQKQAQRRDAEWKAGLHLDHIARYLQQEYEFDGGYAELCRDAERLRPQIRTALIDELMQDPTMTVDQIRRSIEEQIDDDV